MGIVRELKDSARPTSATLLKASSGWPILQPLMAHSEQIWSIKTSPRSGSTLVWVGMPVLFDFRRCRHAMTVAISTDHLYSPITVDVLFSTNNAPLGDRGRLATPYAAASQTPTDSRRRPATRVTTWASSKAALAGGTKIRSWMMGHFGRWCHVFWIQRPGSIYLWLLPATLAAPCQARTATRPNKEKTNERHLNRYEFLPSTAKRQSEHDRCWNSPRIDPKICTAEPDVATAMSAELYPDCICCHAERHLVEHATNLSCSLQLLTRRKRWCSERCLKSNKATGKRSGVVGVAISDI